MKRRRGESTLTEGALVTGKIVIPKDREVPITSNYIVKIGVKDTATLCITHITEENDFSSVKPKAPFAKCIVLKSNPNKPNITWVSVRPSLIKGVVSLEDEYENSMKLPKVGDIVEGIVEDGKSRFGVFVRLSRFNTGLIEKSKISEEFIDNIYEKFPPGMIVKGAVVRTDEKKRNILISLLKKDIAKFSDNVDILKTKDLEEGKCYAAVVISCKPYGVFVELDNSLDLKGLCHRSEIADQEVSDASSMFSKGDKVIVKLIDVSEENGRLSFGMKPSYFSPEELEQFAEEEKDDKMEEEEEESEEEDEVIEENKEEEFTLNDLLEAKTNSPKRRKTNDSKEKDAKMIAKKLVNLSQENRVETSGVDAAIASKPNDSFGWIKAISASVLNGDMKKAKKLAEKALKTIDPRQENEKWNVWAAYCKILYKYDKTDDFEAFLKEGLQIFDKKKVFLEVSELYRVNNKFEECDKALKKANKVEKNKNEDIWLKRVELRFNFSEKLNDKKLVLEAREKILKTATKVIPTKKQPQFLLEVARLEYDVKKCKFALAERGETICQSLLSTFTKRSDIWHQVLDLQIKFCEGQEDNIERIRKLFNRVTSLNFKVKVMRVFFKKWLEFEKKEGSEEQQDQVKTKARNFVKKSMEGEEEEEEE